MTKSDNIEYNKRIEIVLSLIIAGASTPEVLQFAQNNTDWNVGERQVYSYIKKAEIQLSELAQTKREMEFGKAVRRLNNLYSKAYKIQDYKTCLQVQKEINTLLNLYMTDEQHTDSKDYTIIFKQREDE